MLSSSIFLFCVYILGEKKKIKPRKSCEFFSGLGQLSGLMPFKNGQHCFLQLSDQENCSELTLAGCQIPPKAALLLPSPAGEGRK